ncbi:MAG TPA: tetratricopeptide repeat protein [Lachnospiraceae bacterium]|nr:tetratricopeptide repeat protein [Lachnospiraceae bacterium]
MKKIYRTILLVSIVSLMLGISGCGSAKNSQNIELGMAAVQAADYKGALTLFESVQVKKENGLSLYRGQGLAYMGLTKYQEAIASFIKALSYSSGRLSDMEYDINYYLATSYYKDGDSDGAIDTYGAILALKPKEKDAYYLRGAVELESGDYEKAIADFDKAIELDRNNCSTYIDIYICLEQNGYEEKGKEYLETIMDSESKATSDFDKGRICYYLGDYKNACIYFDLANKAVNNEETALFLGKAYEASGDINFAASIYNSFLINHLQSAAIYNQLGLCKMKLKDYEAALVAFQTAMAIKDNSIVQTLKYNEIVAYEFLEDYKKATVLMESYLSTYPDDAAAKREYEFLQTR